MRKRQRPPTAFWIRFTRRASSPASKPTFILSVRNPRASSSATSVSSSPGSSPFTRPSSGTRVSSSHAQPGTRPAAFPSPSRVRSPQTAPSRVSPAARSRQRSGARPGKPGGQPLHQRPRAVDRLVGVAREQRRLSEPDPAIVILCLDENRVESRHRPERQLVRGSKRNFEPVQVHALNECHVHRRWSLRLIGATRRATSAAAAKRLCRPSG